MYSLWGVVYVTRTLALVFVTSLFLLGHCDMKQTSSITISCLTRAHARTHTQNEQQQHLAMVSVPPRSASSACLLFLCHVSYPQLL